MAADAPVTAEYSKEDKERVKAFIARLKAPAEYKDGSTIKRLPARIYRQFWR